LTDVFGSDFAVTRRTIVRERNRRAASLVASSRNGGFVDDTLVPELVPVVESPILAEPTTTAFTTGHAMLTFSTGR
jgi:hypothetical protein